MYSVLKTWSFAMDVRESRQVRKEAAVSEMFHVPEVNLVRAGCSESACFVCSKAGARFFYRHPFDIIDLPMKAGELCLTKRFTANGDLRHSTKS